jgi:ABC-type nitrate/sulfonate/bicarbonate transport system ATPase subunit
MNIHTKQERLLTIEGVSLTYGEKQILRDVNLHIDNIVRPGMQQGQVVALLGPSGVGKTQLFRMIAGLIETQITSKAMTTTGKILLGDKQEPTHAAAVGVVQQAYPLLQHRTVWSNLMLAAAQRYDAKTAAEEANKLLAHFGIEDKKLAYPIQLSGGQRQRVAIIQQLLCANHFLLMDEPFSGLDVVAKRRVYETIQKVASTHEHNTVIFTTHDLESAVRLADEIWVLGREEGKPGATVIRRLDLIQRGLAWDPNISKNPAFWTTVNELYDLFTTL